MQFALDVELQKIDAVEGFLPGTSPHTSFLSETVARRLSDNPFNARAMVGGVALLEGGSEGAKIETYSYPSDHETVRQFIHDQGWQNAL